MIIIGVMTGICFAFMVFLCVRRMRSGETAQMPWAIPSSSINFLDIEYTGQSIMVSRFFWNGTTDMYVVIKPVMSYVVCVA